MNNIFFAPTKIVSGLHCIQKNAHLLSAYGKRATIITGKNSAKLSGSLDDICAALDQLGIEYQVYDGISPNPSIAEARAAAASACAFETDFMIGIGGGSPIDAAKAVAVLVANDLEDTALIQPPWPLPPLAVVAVPTTAGTGSEVTPFAVLTNHTLQTKSSLFHESIIPKLAFLDVRYTYNLPRLVTIHTAVDALSHAVEGYLSRKANAWSDLFAQESLALLGPSLRSLAALSDSSPIPIDLRESLLRASTQAGIVITQAGSTVGHALGYSLTYFLGIDHGRANGIVMPALLDYIAVEHPTRVANILTYLGMSTIQDLATLLSTLLGPVGRISNEQIKQFAAIASQARNVANTLRIPDLPAIEALYSQSFEIDE